DVVGYRLQFVAIAANVVLADQQRAAIDESRILRIFIELSIGLHRATFEHALERVAGNIGLTVGVLGHRALYDALFDRLENNRVVINADHLDAPIAEILQSARRNHRGDVAGSNYAVDIGSIGGQNAVDLCVAGLLAIRVRDMLVKSHVWPGLFDGLVDRSYPQLRVRFDQAASRMPERSRAAHRLDQRLGAKIG